MYLISTLKEEFGRPFAVWSLFLRPPFYMSDDAHSCWGHRESTLSKVPEPFGSLCSTLGVCVLFSTVTVGISGSLGGGGGGSSMGSYSCRLLGMDREVLRKEGKGLRLALGR